jgi:hypothetical protein
MALLAIGLGGTALWMGGLRDEFRPATPAAGLEPLFGRYVIAPGDDPSTLPLPVETAHLIEVDRTGALLVHTGQRVRRQPKPRAFQDVDGRRRIISVRFELDAAGDPRLVVGPYDRTSSLVIEPDENELHFLEGKGRGGRHAP